MDSIKEGKSVTQIVAEVGIEDLPKMDITSTDHALLKLSEKVLQMKGYADVVLSEELKNIDEEKNVGISAFIQTTEKTSFSCSEVLSLLEADDLNIEPDMKSKKASETLNESLTPLRVGCVQDELHSTDLVIKKQSKTHAITINQEGEQIQSKVLIVMLS